MDNRKFQRYDRFMGGYAQWVREGRAVQGLYSVQQWPSGRPQKAAKGLNHSRLPKGAQPWERARAGLLRALATQPSSNREVSKSKILIYPVEKEFELAHSNIVRFPDDLRRFVLVAWIRGKTEIRDISVVLELSSRQIRREKQKVFENIGVSL